VDKEPSTRKEKLMKSSLKTLMATAAVAGVLAVGTAPLFSQNEPPPGPPPATGRTEKPEHKERHPEIRRAIKALEVAKAHLEHADHDFGGHRVKALEDCDRAIEQLKLALKYDKD
jgi:hypothetical protein